MKVVGFHSYYGCETGCCGHRVAFCNNACEPGECRCKIDDEFEFGHPNSPEEALEFAKELVAKKFGEEHVKDLDWDNCKIIDNDNCWG